MLHSFTFGDLTIASNIVAEPTPTGSGYLIPTGPVALLHPFGDTEFYRHGWNSWSPSGWTRTDDETIGIKNSPKRVLTADDTANDTPHSHSGSAVGAITGDNGQVLLLGSLGLGTPRVGADCNTLWGRAEDEAAEWFVAYGPEETVFAEYAHLLSERLGHRSHKAGNVWSSWYSFFEDIDEQLVAETVGDLAGYPFDVFQLDDGWEPIVGDWTTGPKFPSGMAATADTIKSHGFRPGIWLAPLITLPDAPIARDRPDLLVRDDAGKPMITGYNWGSHYYSLDTTHPEVLDHLREVFEQVTGWGYSYLKLDFMYAGALAGNRHRDLPRETVYRDAIQHIRNIVGDNTYILGCGVPMIPTIGVFDGARVGPDVGAFWDNAERSGDPSGVGALNSILDSINRVWMKPLYEIDPDAVYFRSSRNLLDETQRGILQDVASILEFKSTSDPIRWLADPEREQLREYFSGTCDVEQVSRYSFRVDGRPVDFASIMSGTGGATAVSVVA